MFPAEKMMAVVGQFGSIGEVSSYDPQKLRAVGRSLVQAVEDGIAADDAAAQTWWNEMRRLFEKGFDVLRARNEFNAQAEKLKAGARSAAAGIEKFCGELADQVTPVIKGLQTDAQQWTTRASRVNAVQSEVEGLRHIDGWSGPAADQYTTAVEVQVSALTELEGVMTSASQSCGAGALLNQGILLLVDETILEAIETIDAAPTDNGDSYYLKTATSWQVCFALVKQIAEASSGHAAAGAINELAGECVATIEMPRLLGPNQWPTGTSAAGTIPADTSSGVTHDGDTGTGSTGVGGPSDTGVDF